MSDKGITTQIERSLWNTGYQHVAGVDEAGRGCLAGPVVAAAVILPPDLVLPKVKDSKALSPKVREEVRARILEEAVAVGIGRCTPQEIDELNILWAAMEAMRRATEACSPPPDFLLVDGNRCFSEAPCPHETVVRGDQKCHAIAAASIIAKTERDALMRRLHEKHPVYGWNTNVGYPTAAHYEALDLHGPTLYHRHSFKLKRSS